MKVAQLFFLPPRAMTSGAMTEIRAMLAASLRHANCCELGLMPIPRQHDRRHHPRARMSWPVLVKVGTNRYLARSLDISTHGAKVRTKALLKTGTTVQLELVPPEGPLLSVGALVWRVDADGLALLFSHEAQHRLLRAT